jgi:hypothetical protein
LRGICIDIAKREEQILSVWTQGFRGLERAPKRQIGMTPYDAHRKTTGTASSLNSNLQFNRQECSSVSHSNYSTTETDFTVMSTLRVN